MDLSLPPAVRNKTENMLLLMLLPATMKKGQKKYFDFAADFELNDLYFNGICLDTFMYLLHTIIITHLSSAHTQVSKESR